MSDKIEDKKIDEIEEDAIVFTDENGNDIEFSEEACFPYKGKLYSALTPIVKQEGWGDDEVIFCEVSEDEEGYENFELIDDEDLLDELLNELNTHGCGCDDDDCDCNDEECDCGCGDGCACHRDSEDK